jgi:hypothetical protein
MSTQAAIDCIKKLAEADAEIERLRYLLQEQVSCQGQEIERLRGLLRELINARYEWLFDNKMADLDRRVREVLGR